MMKIIVLAVFFFLSFNVYSQKEKLKWKNKPKMEEMEMLKYDMDTTAAAVVLFDSGNSYFQLDEKENGSFKVVFIRKQRIKIFDERGYKYANFSIPVYKKDLLEENFVFTKAITYNLEGEKIVKTKLSKKDIYKKEISENWSEYRFALPDVRDGSVIEIEYRINSDFLYNMQSWKFQDKIPTIWSEYNVLIPEFYNYKKNINGYIPLYLTEERVKAEKFKVRYTQTSVGGGQTRHEYDLSSLSKELYWSAKDVPALKEESHIYNIDDYKSSVEFELMSINMPGQVVKFYTSSWEKVVTTLNESANFGLRMKINLFADNLLKTIVNESDDNTTKTLKIFNYVKNNMKWNNINSTSAFSPLRKIHNDKSGNAAEINLLLTVLLQKAGVTAMPVLISTKNHGAVRDFRPSLSQFNYTICAVKDGENYIPLDATSASTQLGTLPVQCLSQRGFLVQENGFEWIDLTKGQIYDEKTTASLLISENGTIAGKVNRVYSKQAALHIRNEFSKSEYDKDKYLAELNKKYPSIKNTDARILNIDSLHKPVEIELDVELENQTSDIPDLITISPLSFLKETENPFKLEDRSYPVDFAYGRKLVYLFNLKVGDNFTVESLPKPMRIVSKSRKLSLMYNVVHLGNTLTITYLFDVTEPVFVQYEYPELKQFYDLIISKHAEPIVLKKK